jgi:hypothetical protein
MKRQEKHRHTQDPVLHYESSGPFVYHVWSVRINRGRRKERLLDVSVAGCFGGADWFSAADCFRASIFPSSVRRGGCGIKKISAKPTLAPQTGWSVTPNCYLLATTPAAIAATPPHEEGTTRHSK